MEEICTVCGLPKNICVCKEITKETQKIKISLVHRKYKKYITLIAGLQDKKQAKELEKLLKRNLACGGTSHDHDIELQGDHRKKIRQILLKEGYKEELIEG